MLKVRGKRRRQTIFVKHTQPGWLFVSNSLEGLSAIPDDPVVLLGDLATSYDVACHINLRQLPTAEREAWIEQLK